MTNLKIRARYGISIVLLLFISGYVNSLISMNNDKSKKNGTVTRAVLCLATNILPDEVEKRKFLLLHLGGSLLSVTHGNRYLPRGSKKM